MKRFALAALCAVFAGAALAAPPNLDIPADVKPVGGYVRFTPKTDAVSVVYIALDDADPFPSEELKDPRRFLLHTRGMNPGKYRFVAVAAGGTGEQSRAEFTVTIPGTPVPPVPPNPPVPPGPGPQPNPNPQPGPGPNPAPVPAGKRFIVIVEETGESVAARGLILANGELAARITDKGHKFRVVDKDNKTATGNIPADIKPYIAEATGKTRPRLYIVAPDGTVCWYGDCPQGNDAGAQILKLLTAAGG